MDHILHLVVAGVPIRYKASPKALKETLRPFSAAVRLILKDPNLAT